MSKSLLILCSLVFASLLFQTKLNAADQPNILFIFIDDMGWKDTGFMGSDFYETPNLDKLASQGMIFTDAYSCAANCAPARACLLSGQYTPRHEMYNVGTTARGKAQHRKLKHIPGTDTLDPKIKTWAHQLQKAGYQTATMGKWHLSNDPIPYGFHLNIGGTHSGGPPNGYYPPHRNVPGLQDAPKDEYVTERLSDEAIKFIRANKDRPWALYLTHFAVHTPLNAKKDLVPKYNAKTPGDLHAHVAMATMIQSVDDGVGRIQKTLDELDLTDNTVVIFYSDNGGYGPATDMAPLKGYKGAYYEGGIREPFFVKWPGVVHPGSISHEPIIGVDLYPTLCDIAGASLPKNQAGDGLSLLPLLKSEKKTFGHRPLFWHFPAYLQSYGDIHNKEQRDPLFRSRPCGIVRVGDWKLHQYFEDGDLELYNLKADIGEANNLAESNPAKTQELLGILETWRKDINAPVPTEKNPQYDAKVEAAAIAASLAKGDGSKKKGKRKKSS
ncbi:MAG: aryl-sulfate sulfohydrolase [Blastopirellula sp.]|nr:MAG: aryl-sulfate sulfohydrolase [Blastopirellula sp.]